MTDQGGESIGNVERSRPQLGGGELVTSGDVAAMSHVSPKTVADRFDGRAQLPPEEAAAGSDDPETQAKMILEDSDDRTEHPNGTAGGNVDTMISLARSDVRG
jgi:hypothetical protein